MIIRDPSRQQTPIGKGASIMSLLNQRLGRRPINLAVLGGDDPATCAFYAKENGLSHIDGWERFKNLAKRDKHDLSSISSPKGERKSSFSWTSLFKSPTSSTLCFGEPILGMLNPVKLLCNLTSSTLCDLTLAKLNQETEFCITKHIPFCDSVVHTGTAFSVPRSSSETHRVSDCHSNLVTTQSSRMILGKPKIEVTKDPNTSCWQEWGAFL